MFTSDIDSKNIVTVVIFLYMHWTILIKSFLKVVSSFPEKATDVYRNDPGIDRLTYNWDRVDELNTKHGLTYIHHTPTHILFILLHQFAYSIFVNTDTSL